MIVVVGLLAAGMWRVAQAGGRSSIDRKEALEAVELAEAGVGHALALLNGSLETKSLTRLLLGSDSLANTTDDGRLTGYGLDASEQIPAAGRSYGNGWYTVLIKDDPADTDGNLKADSNNKLIIESTGWLADGSTATIRVLVGDSTFMGAMTTGDGLFFQNGFKLAGQYSITGACANVFANGFIEITSDGVVIDQFVATADSIKAKPVVTSSGSPTPMHMWQPVVEVPVYNPLQYCTNPNYILRRNGYVVKTATPRDSVQQPAYGWKCSGCGAASNEWEAQDLAQANAGKICVEGSVKTSGKFGTSTTPLELSIFASGSVKADASPTFQVPAPGEKFVIMSGNDVSLSGGSSTVPNYTGVIYAKGQCKLASSGYYQTTLWCRDDPPASGEKDHFNTHSFAGTQKFVINCGYMGSPFSASGSVRSRRGWAPSLGG